MRAAAPTSPRTSVERAGERVYMRWRGGEIGGMSISDPLLHGWRMQRTIHAGRDCMKIEAPQFDGVTQCSIDLGVSAEGSFRCIIHHGFFDGITADICFLSISGGWPILTSGVRWGSSGMDLVSITDRRLSVSVAQPVPPGVVVRTCFESDLGFVGAGLGVQPTHFLPVDMKQAGRDSARPMIGIRIDNPRRDSMIIYGIDVVGL